MSGIPCHRAQRRSLAREIHVSQMTRIKGKCKEHTQDWEDLCRQPVCTANNLLDAKFKGKNASGDSPVGLQTKGANTCDVGNTLASMTEHKSRFKRLVVEE